jgi:hypothetical protein
MDSFLLTKVNLDCQKDFYLHHSTWYSQYIITKGNH